MSTTHAGLGYVAGSSSHQKPCITHFVDNGSVESVRFYLARRTVMEVLSDRGREIPESEIKRSLNEFRSLFGDDKPDLDRLMISAAFQLNPSLKFVGSVESLRFYLARRAVMEMLSDRGCEIPESEIKRSLAKFRSVFGDKPELERFRISASFRLNPGLKTLVIFCGTAEIRKNDTLGIFNQIVDTESLLGVILVLQNKMNTYVQKEAEKFEAKFKVKVETFHILVIFCGTAEIRKNDAIGIFNQIVDTESLIRVILVSQNKMNSYAQKEGEKFEVKFKVQVETFHEATQISINEAKTTNIEGDSYLELKLPSKSRHVEGSWDFLERFGFHYGDSYCRPSLSSEVVEGEDTSLLVGGWIASTCVDRLHVEVWGTEYGKDSGISLGREKGKRGLEASSSGGPPSKKPLIGERSKSSLVVGLGEHVRKRNDATRPRHALVSKKPESEYLEFCYYDCGFTFTDSFRLNPQNIDIRSYTILGFERTWLVMGRERDGDIFHLNLLSGEMYPVTAPINQVTNLLTAAVTFIPTVITFLGWMRGVSLELMIARENDGVTQWQTLLVPDLVNSNDLNLFSIRLTVNNEIVGLLSDHRVFAIDMNGNRAPSYPSRIFLFSRCSPT